MYGPRGLWEPYGLPPANVAGSGKTEFICVAEVATQSGNRQCGKRFEGGCCMATHAVRPMPYVKKVAFGLHLARVVRGTRQHHVHV